MATAASEARDTRPGMSLADHQHAFEPFWQADPMSTKSSGSTGLGLSVARQFARLLGGGVFVLRSVIGVGRTFVVSLPARYRGGADGVNSDSVVERCLSSPRRAREHQRAALAPRCCQLDLVWHAHVLVIAARFPGGGPRDLGA